MTVTWGFQTKDASRLYSSDFVPFQQALTWHGSNSFPAEFQGGVPKQ